MDDAEGPPAKRARLDPDSTVQGLFDKLGAFERPVNEIDVEITEYVQAGTRPIQAIIKHRFTDFLVHEVDLQGKVVKLESLAAPAKESEPPKAAVDPKDAELEATAEADWSSAAALSIQELLGDAFLDKLKDLYGQGSQSSEKLPTTPIESKEQRTAFHKAIRALFSNKIITETQITAGAASNDVIVVRWAQNARDRARRAPGKPKDDKPPFLHFTLHKFNRETNDALGQISTLLRVPLRDLGIAGTKDKRSASTQRVSLKRGRRTATEVWNALQDKAQKHRPGNNRNQGDSWQSRLLKGIRVGNFDYAGSPLDLGQLSGNHFTITLRDVPSDDVELAGQAIESVKANGFINYFGMQRFGTSTIPSHAIGLALLRSEWSRAAEFIMRVKPGDSEDATAARKLWIEDKDAEAALRLMPKFAMAERALLGAYRLKKEVTAESDHFDALAQIPKKLKMMYIHAYQSYLWNVMVSERLKRFGHQPIIGDLVYADAGNTQDEDALEQDATNGKTEIGHKIPAVKVLKAADLESYNIFDIVVPLPGHIVSFPAGQIGDLYRRHMEADGLDPDDMQRKQPEYSMAGTYRRIMHRPSNVSYKCLRYNDPDAGLALTDEDLIFGKTLQPEPEDAKHCAVQVELTLGTSIYATMALREILKCETTMGAQKELTQAMLAREEVDVMD